MTGSAFRYVSIGFLLNSVMARLAGLRPMDDIVYPILLLVVLCISEAIAQTKEIEG